MAAQLSAKSVLGVLNGLSRRLYFGDESMTDEFLREQVEYGGSIEEFSAILKRYESLLVSIAAAHMEFTQLQAFLSSQTKKRENPLSEDDVPVLQKFWKSQRTKIHEALVRRSHADGQLTDLSWRIDVKSKARNLDQINQPTAIVEMQIDQSVGKGREILRFEMDEQHTKDMLQHINDIQTQIDKFTK
ncbi:COMM domain-containing protein 1-like [Sycon ciliatum]|uniref:COMM domain-containing protein 1-like n=1 Tax=Sycon ciliatum TaxID=27933 RepID=UPI0031F6A676